jgi:hypothetical protein
MTDDQDRPATDAEEEARDRIEDARSEAAAYVIQRQPLEPASADDIAGPEERIVSAVEGARTEDDPDQLQDLAKDAERGRDEIRRQMYGAGSERRPEDPS